MVAIDGQLDQAHFSPVFGEEGSGATGLHQRRLGPLIPNSSHTSTGASGFQLLPLINSTWGRLGSLIFLFTLCSMLAGCGKSKVTQENFEKLEKDMTLEDVEHILGNGTPAGGDGALIAAQGGIDVSGGARASSTVEYIWEIGQNSITVAIRNGKVIQVRKKGF